MKPRIVLNALLLGDVKTLSEPFVNFLQRVWPFSRWDFTECARERRRILEHLASTREDFYNDPEVRKQLGVNDDL
jgi:hypothetical protein